jgi:thymidine kinase
MDIKGKGSIDLILGPVYAGKTSELLRRIRRFQFSKVKCLVVRHHSSNADREDIEKAFQR